MKTEKGKLYVFNTGTICVIMCTETRDDIRMSGVVVAQTDKTSDHRVGNYSKTWTSHPDYLTEFVGTVIIDNEVWEEHQEIGCSQG